MNGFQVFAPQGRVLNKELMNKKIMYKELIQSVPRPCGTFGEIKAPILKETEGLTVAEVLEETLAEVLEEIAAEVLEETVAEALEETVAEALEETVAEVLEETVEILVLEEEAEEVMLPGVPQ